MKRLALLIVFIVGACGSSSSGPVDPPVSFTAAWDILDEFSQPITCDSVPADTVTIDFVRRANGDRDIYEFNCEQGLVPQSVSGAGLTVGTYDVDVTLWFDYQGPNEQVVGTVPLVVVNVAPVTDLPDIVFHL